MISVNSQIDVLLSVYVNTYISETLRARATQFDNNLPTIVRRSFICFIIWSRSFPLKPISENFTMNTYVYYIY